MIMDNICIWLGLPGIQLLKRYPLGSHTLNRIVSVKLGSLIKALEIKIAKEIIITVPVLSESSGFIPF